MTEEVGALALRNNYLQSLALSLAERRGSAEIGSARIQMRQLEQHGRLDRAVERLPSDTSLTAREARGEGMTRPELAVLLAYAKLALHDDLLASALPDEPYLATELTRYFPKAVRELFPDAVSAHRLRREIIATQIANAIVNRAGAGIVARLMDETGADADGVARAYVLTRDAFGLLELNLAIDGLDAMLPGAVQNALYGTVQETLIGRMIWFLRNVDVARPLIEQVARFSAGVAAVAAAVATTGAALGAGQDERAKAIAVWTSQGVPLEIAVRIVDLPALQAAPDGVMIAERSGASVADGVMTLFAAADSLGVDRLKQAALGLKPVDRFERLAMERALERCDLALRTVSVDIVRNHGGGAAGLAAWRSNRIPALDKLQAALAELADGGLSVAKLSVAASLIDDLARVHALA